MQSYEQAWSFVAAFAGDPNAAVIDWRCIHDTDKGVPGIPFRGTLPECWSTILQYNNLGYGAFAVIAAMDGVGRELANVSYIRAHYVDLDNISAQQNYERATAWLPAPSFAVQSSPGKYHVYWPVQFYAGNDRFTLTQRKLRQMFDADRIIDATRVMRVPGTLHLKDPANPHLVTCWSLAGYGQWHDPAALEAALQMVNVIDGGAGQRHDLGDPELAAPSLHWIEYGLNLLDPNKLDRGEWIATTAAVKQAGWSLTDPDNLFRIWSEWCATYTENDPAENLKQWNSVRNTELGWQSFLNRVPALRATMTLMNRPAGAAPVTAPPMPVAADPALPPPAMPEPPALDCSGEFLTHFEQQQWFKGCIFVVNVGEMLAPDGRFLNKTQFDVAFGGKKFIIDAVGKMVNEAWQAATRSTLWTVPKVDHTRFVPDMPHGEIITDELGRKGVNTYKPAKITRQPGDVGPFLRHIEALLPDPNDRKVLLDYLAHNARYPGYKIAWAPVIQSAEGAGKGVIKRIMRHVMGKPYFYTPKASELAQSGAKFNAWLRHRLFILVDEIKVDEKRELIEVLKPLISEEDTEIQGKGVDQDLEDNFSNWLFFSNWRDAIPINKNARRFAIMFSPLQTVDDLIARGMGDDYFTALYDWLDDGGAGMVADYLLTYPIARGGIPKRAPATTSTDAAISLSRGPIERLVMEAVEDQLPGFRGGWISAIAVANRIKATGAVRGGAALPQTITTVLEAMGYRPHGRAPRPFFAEDRESRAYLFKLGAAGDVGEFGRLQGYEA